ncbi:MAG: NAD(P)H:quinone oxidoreductase [Solirubrobacteraceae bacterium]|nr:NAD(P)H:quinone oxidoreductase [Solirubrobacteraceae bacterium]
MTKIAVIYYSATGTVHELATQIAAGAEAEGAEVRLRRVKELAPAEAIASNAGWQQHVEEVHPKVAEASIDDLEWADGIALGSPTRFGLPAAQLKQFIDQAGPLWGKGALASKAATPFTSASTTHGGHESTALAIANTFYHWGSIVVPLGYTSEAAAGTGTPYGISALTGPLSDETIAAAKAQGARLATIAAKLAA